MRWKERKGKEGVKAWRDGRVGNGRMGHPRWNLRAKTVVTEALVNS
jgi:hypothetical protein